MQKLSSGEERHSQITQRAQIVLTLLHLAMKAAGFPEKICVHRSGRAFQRFNKKSFTAEIAEYAEI